MNSSIGNDRRLGILGVGKVGTTLARLAMGAGYDVDIAGSGAASDIELIVDFTARGAHALTTAEVVDGSDVILLATPLHRYRTLPVDLLAGKIVVDAMNYWVAANGTLDEFERAREGTSDIVSRFLTRSRLVKTLNHIGYHEMETDGRPAGAPDRRALAVSSDDADAKTVVTAILEDFGFDGVDAGSLAQGRLFEPGSEIFEGSHDAAALRVLIADASLTSATLAAS